MSSNRSKTKFSIRIIPTSASFGLIWIDSDWKFGLDQSEFGLIRIGSDSFALLTGLNRIRLDRFFYRFSSNDLHNVFQIGSEWFELARTQISELIGIVLIGSEWTPIRYFRQGIKLQEINLSVCKLYKTEREARGSNRTKREARR